MELLELFPFVMLALAGSLHCIGMCGGLAVAARRKSPWWDHLAFVLGKACTYVILGVAVHRARHVFEDAGAHMPGFPGVDGSDLARALLAWGVGGTLVLLGLRRIIHTERPIFRPLGGTTGALLARPFASIRSAVDALPGVAAPFGLGLVTGLLPCGLTGAALLYAAQSSVQRAIAGMFVFGCVTGLSLAVPAFVAGWAGWGKRERLARLVRWSVGPALVILGLLIVWRGGVSVAGQGHSCCTSSASSATGTEHP